MTTTQAITAAEKRYDWPVCYEAEDLLLEYSEAFLQRNSFARKLADRMSAEAGTLFLDWIDHLMVPSTEEARLRDVGFDDDPHADPGSTEMVLRHPEAMLPAVRLSTMPGPAMRIALKCESVEAFLAAHRLVAKPQGPPLSRYRHVTVASESDAELQAIERRGYAGFLPQETAVGTAALLTARELWRTRPRHFPDDAKGFRHTHELLDRVITLLGRDLACHVVFEAEREYWQSRNRAGQIQKQRQDALGFGWANHDHHTFRSSREHFVDLMRALEKLGFERRERFYAGAQAGWGAQVLEQPIEGIVVFADVDLLPAETEIDFSRMNLSPSPTLGTVGLWVALHGESFLQAGMHHLEARFDFTLVRDQLQQQDIGGLPPFSDFAFLKQAFTEGERWPVERARADALLRRGLITQEQHQRFISEGAIGSHLETLQRKGGFKGFNQKAVSAIIAATDPRRQHVHG